MFLNDYRNSVLSYDDAQFVISLALDSLDEVKAARAVLFFMSPQSKNNTDDVPYKTREELVRGLLDQSQSRKEDIITVALDYYYSYNLFNSGKVINRVYGGKSWCDLGHLVKVATKASIYNRTMHLILNNDRNKFITLYTKSQMFRHEFSRVLNRESGSSGSSDYRGKVPDSLVDELNIKFTQFVNHNCANGTYRAATCNPDAYLFKRKNASRVAEQGPFGWFQLENNGEYYRILNRHGLNINAGGSEDLTLLDSVSIDVSQPDQPIRFISLCSKICNASYLLFSHSDMPTAYYDIFSYHRDIIMRETKAKFKKEQIKGCDINFADGKYAIDDLSQTIANKFNCRSKICDIFEEVLSYGIRTDKINNLYDRIIRCMEQECAGSTGTKDAKSPFSIFNYTSREPGTNGSRFQTLLFGYMALRELLTFLDSDSNVLGITINQFPIDIFRDKNLLKRFATFEEYIEYIDDIIPVYSAVAGNSMRSRVLLHRMYNNDYVFDLLSGRQIIRYDVNLDLLSHAPVSAINVAISRYDDAGVEKEMNNTLTEAYHSLEGSFAFIGKLHPVLAKIGITTLLDTNALLQKNYADYNVLSHVVARYICTFVGRPLDSLRENTANYVAVCVFASLLRAASQQPDDRPIYNNVGRYLLENKSLLESMYLPDSYIKKDGDEQTIREVLMQRAYALRVSMWFLWGEQKENSVLKKCQASWDDCWCFWKITVMLSRYLLTNSSILTKMYSNTKDTHLMSIRATALSDFLTIPEKITSEDPLGIVVSDKDPSLFIRRSTVDNYAEVSAKRSKLIVEVFNRLFANFHSQFRFYEILEAKSKITFGSLKNSCLSNSLEIDRILESKVPYLNSRYLTGEVNMVLAQQLLTLAEFDEIGYVLVDNSRYVYKNKKYVHKTGFVVEVEPITKQGFVGELTDEIMCNLKARLAAS